MVETEYRLLLPQKLIDITELKKNKKKKLDAEMG